MSSHPLSRIWNPQFRAHFKKLENKHLLRWSLLALILATLAGVAAPAQAQGRLKVYPSPGQTGIWPGTSITLDFGLAVDTASVEAAFSIDPDIGDYEPVWRSSQQLELRPREPLDATTRYELSLGVGAKDARGNPIFEEPYRWSFTTSQHSGQLSFGYGVPVQLVAPSGRHGLGLQTNYPRLTVDFALYELDLQGFATRYAPLQPGSANEIDLTGLSKAAEWSQHLDNSNGTQGVALPKDTEAGLYVVDAQHPDLGSAQLLLIHSDHTLVAKRGRAGLGAWLTSYPGGVPAAGANVMALDADGKPLGDAQTTNAEGLAGLGDVAADAGFLVAELGDETSIVGLDGNWLSGYGYWRWWGGGYDPPPVEYSGHIHTDRPIYRPGHDVHYKATLRRFTGDADRLAVVDASTAISVTIRDPRNNVVRREAATADDFGSIAGSLTLADEVTLGQWRIEVRSGDWTKSGYFQVQEYVKPDFAVDVQTDRPWYVRGDTAQITVNADYYFGQPVAGGDATLRVYRGYWWRGRGDQPLQTFEGKLDADGALTAPMRLDGNQDYAETFTLEAEVVDASRRPVVHTVYVTVHPADFTLRLTNQRYGVEAGNPVNFEASAIDHDGQPVGGRNITVELRQYERRGYRVIETRQATTGADGTADVVFDALPEGWYSVQATTADDGGRRVTANSYAWVYSNVRPWYWWGGLELQADRDEYAPGDTAQILIKSPITTTALITIERDEVYEERVVPVSGATTVALDIGADYAPNVTVKAHLWQPDSEEIWQGREGQLLTAELSLKVPAEDQRLSVDIVPDQPDYGPGDEAGFTIRVRDAAGAPVDAQLSLALVDKAVLALADDRSGEIFDAFWTNWGNATRTYDSAQVGTTYDAPEDAAPGRGGGGEPPSPEPSPDEGAEDDKSQATPRREFRDTAYWNATLETGPDGEVSVRVKLPDNLTTWEAFARAITKETKVGQGRAEVLVTKPIIADPALPRFAIQGDEFALDVLARNYASNDALEAGCSLAAPGLIQLDPGDRTLQLPFGETRLARWSVVASKVGTDLITADLQTSAGADIIELPLEIQPFAVPQRFAIGGSTEDYVIETFELPYHAVPEASSVEISLAPSAALGVLEGIEDLIGYPYGCVEQTMGKVLPNAVIARLNEAIPLDAPEIQADLPEYMEAGLQKLYGFQSADGGWGWWQGEGNIYTTAYVMHGLLLTRDAGYLVDEDAIQRGLNWLASHVEAEKDARLQAYSLYVLNEGGMGNRDLAARLAPKSDSLDPFAQAALAIALQGAGETELASDVLDSLESRATVLANSASWPMTYPEGERWEWYSWRSMASTEKNTAMALDALARLRPESELAPKAAHWLLTHRWGRGWRTTQATAFAVMGLTDYILASGDLGADYDWSVSLNGQELASGHVDASNAVQPIDPVIVDGSLLSAGNHALRLNKTGPGTLYYSINGKLSLYHDGFEQTEAEGMGLSIRREYMPIEGRSGAGGWEAGDLINVRLTVEAQDELHYLIIEDKLPAGLEALNQALNTETTRIPGDEPWWRWWGYERKEIRDDAVSFFRSYMRPGSHTFEYAARAVTPGTFSALPAEAYAMYRPEVWGRSASDRVIIDDEKVVERPILNGDFDRDCRLTDFDASLVAADWAEGSGRDLNGDGRVSVADIGIASGRAAAGLACGDAAPAVPEESRTATLGMLANGPIQVGRVFEVEVDLTLADFGGWEATIKLPSSVEFVGSSHIPGQFSLDAVLDEESRTLRLGGWSPTDATGELHEVIVATIELRVMDDRPFELSFQDAEAVTPEGGSFELDLVDGKTIIPEAWDPAGVIYLPSVQTQGR